MADHMDFPATVEEFMERYKITDTEEVYTNGIELVPIFRMRQWFDRHPTADVVPVVRCDDCEYYGSRRWCELHSSVFDDNAFCSYGERKE